MAWELNGNSGTNGNNFLGTTDNQSLILKTNGKETFRISPNGNVGIGTEAPSAKLNIDPKGAGGIIIGNPSTGQGGFTSLILNIDAEKGGKSSIQSIRSSGSAFGNLSLNPFGGNVGIGTNDPKVKLHVIGDIEVTGDIRLTNADCAEDFDICDAEQVEPGTVMVLSEDGRLECSQTAYDKRVAGVISGAGDYKPGIVLDKQQSQSGRKPVALLGKVFCKVDAQYGAIETGDLLTTAPTPGYAMKAGDPLKASGAVIGKAIRPLAEGQGLIPILIALQ